MPSPQFISSGQAVRILREVADRPRASRSFLKMLVDRGLILANPVHARCSIYDPSQVREVASRLGRGGRRES